VAGTGMVLLVAGTVLLLGLGKPHSVRLGRLWRCVTWSSLYHCCVCCADAPSPLPADIAGKFAASAWGKKLAARSAKANMTDLDRYKAMVAKCKRSRLVRTAFNKLKKSA